jgi:hypothetical protein
MEYIIVTPIVIAIHIPIVIVVPVVFVILWPWPHGVGHPLATTISG